MALTAGVMIGLPFLLRKPLIISSRFFVLKRIAEPTIQKAA